MSRKRSKKGEIPEIKRHKPSGRAYIWLDGKREYLGQFGSVEAEKERLKKWAEYQANLEFPENPGYLTVDELAVRFLEEAKEIYVKNGRSTGSAERFCVVVRPLSKLYGSIAVDAFGPLALKAVRNVWIAEGQGRKTVNTKTGLLRHIFKWGLENELVRPETLVALQSVRDLKKGRTRAKEYPDVPKVRDEVVKKTLPLLQPAIGTMVLLQRMTGMRPGEVVAMRPADIYREGDDYPDGYDFPPLRGCWVYIPEEHKTEHHNQIRFLALNPACQKLLEPYLKRREHEEYIFSPAGEQEIRHEKMRQARKTKVQPSQFSRKTISPKRSPGRKYTPNSYRTAIQRAIERHNERLLQGKTEEEKRELKKELIPKWFPNQLRHAMASEIRRKADAETAQVVLGHKRLQTTEIYAEMAKEKAIDFALETVDNLFE